MSASSSSASLAPSQRPGSGSGAILARLHAVFSDTGGPSLLATRDALLAARRSAQSGIVRLSAEAADDLHTALLGYARLREQARATHHELKVCRAEGPGCVCRLGS